MNLTKRIIFSAVLSVILPLGAQAGSEETAKNADIIKIGEVGSLTGSAAPLGKSGSKGIKLAVDELNAAGGIAGKKVQLFTIDSGSVPEQAKMAATKLIKENEVIAILGENASSLSLAMAPVAQANQTPMISPASTNPKVTEAGNYVFRVCFIDPFQGEVMAKFAKDTLKAKKVAILTDGKLEYSKGLAEFFRKTFTKDGGQVVFEQSFNSGDTNFKNQLTAIKSLPTDKSPDAIFIPSYPVEAAYIAKQAREIGITIPLLGGDGWDSSDFSKIAGGVSNAYFSNHYAVEDKSPANQAFVTKFKKAYGELPDGSAAMGYDATMVLADAIKRAKSLSQVDIGSAIAVTKDFQGVTGKITLDSHRNAIKPAVVLKVENGQFKYFTTVNPTTPKV